MSEQQRPSTEPGADPVPQPAAGESESVAAPHRDDPPRRQGLPFVWLALLMLAALAVGGLVVALGLGALD